MPPAARGRRNPALLQDQQVDEQAQQQIEPEFDNEPEITLLYEGESITASISVPVNLDGMDRYSLVAGEAHVTVQVGEEGHHAAARARAAARVQFFSQIDEMEESLAAYAEEKAAEEEQIQAQLNRR